MKLLITQVGQDGNASYVVTPSPEAAPVGYVHTNTRVIEVTDEKGTRILKEMSTSMNLQTELWGLFYRMF